MDVLKNKSLRKYDNLSRYQTVPFYYHELDEKYTVGITSWLKLTTKYSIYTIQEGDSLDSIALKFYNAPTFYWIIADFNRISDPFVNLPAGEQLKIPVLSNIEFEENS